MESSAMQETTIRIDDSSEAFAERLELCVLRSASFDADRPELPGCSFFAEAFRLLEERRTGTDSAGTDAAGTAVVGADVVGVGCLDETSSGLELCKLFDFWKEELEGLLPINKEGCVQDLVPAWETTLQMLFEVESSQQEGRPVNEKELRDILYSYNYDYAEEFLCRDAAHRKEGKRIPRRFVTELVFSAGNGAEGTLSFHAQEGIRLFFGDRLKSRLLEAMEKAGLTSENGRETEHGNNERKTPADLTGLQGLGTHQKKSLTEFFARAALLALLAMCGLFMSACGKEENEEETLMVQTEAADVYPGTVCYQSQDGTINDRFGVMHATVLEVQKGEKDGLYVYTLRDEQDPDNVWCLYSQDIGSIVAEMNGGKKVAVLFSGDIVSDPDSVEFIAVLDDAPYTIKEAEGSTTANMMNSFKVRTKKGQELTFIKDNCKVDRDALSTDSNANVRIFYADCGGDKYPVRVYKAEETRQKQ